MSLRVVIVTRIPPVLAGFDAVVRGAGHEPVALLTMRNVDGRYGPTMTTDELVMGAAPELDVLLPARRSTIARLPVRSRGDTAPDSTPPATTGRAPDAPAASDG